MKLEPCLTERRRHNWEHEGNKTARRSFRDGSVELSRRGVYQCTACGAVKYGEPREQTHVRAVAKAPS